MKKLVAIFLSTIIIHVAQAQQGAKGDFVAGLGSFLLNGEPFIIRAGELHYPRIPKAYWQHRIAMCKAMGMNTICIYLFWNYHEQEEGVFDFSGDKDVAAFVKMVQAQGMYCIVRPGPYACAEWDMGGLPWWLLKQKDIQVRTHNNSYFLEKASRYLKEVGKQLAPLQIQHGGNIIMVQVENEYASFGTDSNYMQAIKQAVRAAGFDKVQLFRCDWSSNFYKYNVDGVATTLNFGAGANIEQQFKTFKEKNPTAPLMCSEYWSGWFDHWGKPHETRSINSFIGSYKEMLDKQISVSLYMAHGGTSFGQWGGANAPPYSAMATSYDYNAPIDEQGSATDKFYAVRAMMQQYLQKGETLPPVPAAKPIIRFPVCTLHTVAKLFDNLPKPIFSKEIQPMEMFNQGWGSILYRTQLPTGEARKLKITELHDWAMVFINGKLIATLDRRMGQNIVSLPKLSATSTLDILVEATGRVNYGKAIIDRKGITEKVELIDKDTVALKDWWVYCLPVAYDFQKNKQYKRGVPADVAWYKGTIVLDSIGDTYIDMRNWGKGMVWVNGHNLGRFWKIGPQQTLFMPGCWLKKGENEVIVFNMEQPQATIVNGLDQPILDKIIPDTSRLHRKKGQQLDLSKEIPVVQGSFTTGTGWKEVLFDSVYAGRYFCLEALTGMKANETAASIAELELIAPDGSLLPRLQWNIVYADSEEVTAANQTADNVFDLQESTYWQTAWAGQKTSYPHQIVIDLGANMLVKGFKYLPRNDKNATGNIKDYRCFLKLMPFKY